MQPFLARGTLLKTNVRLIFAVEEQAGIIVISAANSETPADTLAVRTPLLLKYQCPSWVQSEQQILGVIRTEFRVYDVSKIEVEGTDP
jgi:hypothetical protein